MLNIYRNDKGYPVKVVDNNKELVLEDVDGRWLGFGVKLDTNKWKNFNNKNQVN